MFVKTNTKVVNVTGDIFASPTIATVTGNVEKAFRSKFDDMLVRYIEESNTVVINRMGV